MRQQTRGNVIMLVMAIMFAAITLMAALFQISSTTWMSLMRTESDLEAFQIARFQLFEQVRGQRLTPYSRLGLKLQDSEDSSLWNPNHSARLFTEGDGKWNGLSDLKAPTDLKSNPGQQGYPGHRYFRYTYSRAGRDGGMTATVAGDFGYAAFTGNPNSEAVTLSQVASWKNPTFGKVDNPTQEYSSVSPRILGVGKVTVADMPTGHVISSVLPSLRQTQAGTGAIAHRVRELRDPNLPGSPDQTAQAIRQQLQDARRRIVAQASKVEKTSFFTDDMRPGDGLGLFFSQAALPAKYQDHLSVRQSQGFWIPTIPGFTKQFMIMYHLIFHIPDRPDGGLSDLAQIAQAALGGLVDTVMQLDKAVDYLKDAEKAMQDARDWLNDHMNCGNCVYPWNWPCCAAREAAKLALYAAEAVLIGAEAAVELIEQAILVIVSPITDTLTAILAAHGQLPEPTSRTDQNHYKQRYSANLNSTGMDFWAYRSVFNGIGNVFNDLFHGDIDEVGRDFGHSLNVVFFGQANKQQGWDFNNRVTTRSTMNVPANRSLTIHSNLNIQGDLWLGRGSTMVVFGDLTLGPDNFQYKDMRLGPTVARGRLYLEEGAKLVTTGKIELAGDAAGGSVVQTGPIGAVHPISSAIFCGKTFRAPFGIITGVSADELDGVKACFGPILKSLGANLAKIEGPFHRRLPYIARYATTFEWITPPGIPFVIPQSFPNLTVMVFRGLSALYAPTLNFELGDNFMTHCDWWGEKGEGRPPILSKPMAIAARDRLSSGDWRIGISGSLSQQLSTRAGQIGAGAVNDFSNGLCLALAREWAKAIVVSSGIPMVSVGKVINKILGLLETYKIDTIEGDQDKVILAGSLNPLSRSMTQFWTIVDNTPSRSPNELPQECAGVLVYAEDQLYIGSDSQPAEIASGWFIAESHIKVEAKVCVGALTSLSNGTIRAQRLLYYPAFTQASLYLPPDENTNWLERGKNDRYASEDGRAPSDKSVVIGHSQQLRWHGVGRVR